MVILAVLAVVTGAMFAQAHANLTRQAHRRVAMELANGRLECLRASAYGSLRPASNQATLYLTGGPITWLRFATETHETLAVGTAAYDMVTRVDTFEVDAASPTQNCLRVRVTVADAAGGCPVTLSTLCARKNPRP